MVNLELEKYTFHKKNTSSLRKKLRTWQRTITILKKKSRESDEKALTEKGARKISMLKKKQYNPDKDQESRSVSRKYCKNLYKKQESRKTPRNI